MLYVCLNSSRAAPSECCELLRAERNEALQYTTDLKRAVGDLAKQEEETYREVSWGVSKGRSAVLWL